MQNDDRSDQHEGECFLEEPTSGHLLDKFWPFRRKARLGEPSKRASREDGGQDPKSSGARDRGADAAQLLHFTIGPVQTFVAEARRTRDLWAGSFLLSWLTGQAMAEAEHKLKGKIEFPKVAGDPLYKAILASRTASARGAIGKELRPDYQPSLTNHFVARFPNAGITRRTIKDDIVKHVHVKWCELAEAVWQCFLEPLGELDPDQHKLTRKIWDRQIGIAGNAFWDIIWVLGPEEGDHGVWLEQRKTWRAFETPEEPGDMCRMMGHYQELSGHVGARDTNKQKKFWDSVRKLISEQLREATGAEVELLDLRESERLCAIAFVKRMFPRLPPKDSPGGTRQGLETIIGWLPESHDKYVKANGNPDRLHISYRPSTAFMAAAHWVARAALAGQEAVAFRKVVAANVHHVLAQAERHTNLSSHDECRNSSPDFASTDGRLFYKSVLLAKGKGLRPSKEPGLHEPKLVFDSLSNLMGAKLPDTVKRRRSRSGAYPPPETERLAVGEPSPYYAVLLMDGDNVGKLIRSNAEAIKKPLAAFAEQAESIVTKAYSGSLIYAGGDDLLALLPIEDALPAAEMARARYQELMAEIPEIGEKGTISAAIIFAHYEASLSGVLRRAHQLLDAVAKEENGRSSLVLALHRTDGTGPEWVSTWEWRHDLNDPAKGLAKIACDIQELASRGNSLVRLDPSKKERSSTYGVTSNRFVYGVHDRMGAFFKKAQSQEQPFIEQALTDLLRAIGGKEAQTVEPEDWSRLVRVLTPQCRRPKRGELRQELKDRTRSDFNGLLILRFLASEWRRIETS
jgi:CRISPR-associated protein Cmr2